MAKLIYSAITSLDGYVANEADNFNWGEVGDGIRLRPGSASWGGSRLDVDRRGEALDRKLLLKRTTSPRGESLQSR